MIVMPLLPIETVISKKLYDLNTAKYRKELALDCGCMYYSCYSDIAAKIAKLDKFTIVELTYHGNHYHGLASQALCDKASFYTGIAVAYNRAFKKMCGDNI